jgi:diguanylate cyclase (GGDEF)-like protein
MAARLATVCTALEKRSDDAITAVVGYFLLAAATIHLTSDGRNHAAMWPADALVLALLLKNGRRNWPAILVAGCVANLLANTLTRGWTPGLILYGAINMGQTCLAAWLMRRWSRSADLYPDLPGVLRFVLYAGIVAPVCGAAAGALATAYNYAQPLGPSFVRWYVSNALGLLVVTPFLLALFDGSYRRWLAGRSLAGWVEVIGLVAVHLAVTFAVFSQDLLPALFVPVSTVLVLSYRLGRLGTISGVMLVALIGGIAMFHRIGPISPIRAGIEVEEFFFQFYLAVMLATTLPVAATVSSRAEALVRVAEREEALRLMMAHSPDGVLSFDIAGRCRWADGPLLAYLGIDSAGMIGRSLDAVALQAREMVVMLSAAGEAGLQRPGMFEFVPPLRPHLTLAASVGVLRSDGVVVGSVVTLRDATRRKTKEAASLSPVHGDELTGLVGRAGFHKHLRASLEDIARPTTLALVDVDGFRAINEAHGHVVGDAVLAEIARRLKAATRADDVVARLGGDEFAVLLRCELATARTVCQRMVEAIRETPVAGDGVVAVLASIRCGIAEARPGAPRDEVFDAADTALYELKRSGRNGIRTAA